MIKVGLLPRLLRHCYFLKMRFVNISLNTETPKKAVTEYLKTAKIQLHFLPPYSPNLNPIERLWKWMKERVIYNTYYREFEDFRSAVFGFFSTLATLGTNSILGQDFRSRVRDKFRPIHAPVMGF